jgi:hypothetical protein
MDFIKNNFPSVYEELKKLYKRGGADREYKTKLYQTINRLRNKYSLSSSYMKPMKEN